jgi:hypothetical protein
MPALSTVEGGGCKMERMKVSSSNISEIGYDRASGTLEVSFSGGGVYQYAGVPKSVYDHFAAAPSKGVYFASVIKNGYKFTKLR